MVDIRSSAPCINNPTYTLSQKTGPILFLQYLWFLMIDFKIFCSPLQLEMICAHMWNKIYHLTLTALPHYRAKYEQVQFCKN